MRLIQRCGECRRFIKPKSLCKCGRSLKGHYWVEYRVNGKLKREKVGDKDLAEIRMGDIQRAILEKRHLNINKNAEYTLDGIIKWYGDLKEVQDLKSYKERMRSLNFIKLGLGAEILVSGLSPSLLLRWRSDRQNEVSNASCNREISYLKTCIKKGVDYGILETNPISGVSQLKEDNHRNVGLTVSELNNLLSNADDCIRDIIAVGFYTMMRKGEILALSQNDVQGNWITLPKEKTKMGKSRMIPIPPEIQHIFAKRRCLFGAESLFNKKRYSRSYYDKASLKAIKASNLGDFHFHDLRHAGAQWYYDNGNDIPTIMQIGGWESFDVLKRYLFNNKKKLNVKFG